KVAMQVLFLAMLVSNRLLEWARGRPFMPRASKRGLPNNGNLPQVTQNHARWRCESAGAARHGRPCRANKECPRSREAIGSSWGWQMRGSRKLSHRSNPAAGKE